MGIVLVFLGVAIIGYGIVIGCRARETWEAASIPTSGTVVGCRSFDRGRYSVAVFIKETGREVEVLLNYRPEIGALVAVRYSPKDHLLVLPDGVSSARVVPSLLAWIGACLILVGFFFHH